MKSNNNKYVVICNNKERGEKSMKFKNFINFF